MERAALFLYGEKDGTVHCGLCPHACTIPDGNFGVCGVRGNKNGKGLIPFYGYITALALDPIEKKPLYHFRPGSMILSAGFLGCNLCCPFCQNWRISRACATGGGASGGGEDGTATRGGAAPGKYMRPGDLVSAALRQNSEAIAYTYSEPLVHIEFLLDCMDMAHRHGIANVLVTNGCVNTGAAGEILSLADAANIDLKCFSPDTYEKTLCGNLETVLAFIRLARIKGVHVEVTTLIVPDLNDNEAELDACADFIVSLNNESKMPEIPWHLSAYHPDYRWNAPPTDPDLLLQTKKRAAGKLRYVYAGNIQGIESNTVCPCCGEVLVRRSGYRVEIDGLVQPAQGEIFFLCAHCGGMTPLRG